MIPSTKKETLTMPEILLYSCCEQLSTSLQLLRTSIDRYEEHKKNRDTNKLKQDLEELNDDRRE